jgi:hypothetical protein
MTNTEHTASAKTHTPEPWDCDASTIFYATPDESDGMTMIEVRARVTEAGWDTVAFIEATWPGAEVNARRIVAAVNACAGIPTQLLEQGVVAELLEACQYVQPHLEEYVHWHHKHQGGCSVEMEQALDLINAVIAKTAGSSLAAPRKPIVIEVRGGVVQEVLNVPPGYDYEVKDYDNIETDGGAV